MVALSAYEWGSEGMSIVCEFNAGMTLEEVKETLASLKKTIEELTPTLAPCQLVMGIQQSVSFAFFDIVVC